MTWERDAPQVFNNCSFAFRISMTNQLVTRRKIIREQSSIYQQIAERPYQPSLLIFAGTTVASLLSSLSRMHGCSSLSLSRSVCLCLPVFDSDFHTKMASETTVRSPSSSLSFSRTNGSKTSLHRSQWWLIRVESMQTDCWKNNRVQCLLAWKRLRQMYAAAQIDVNRYTRTSFDDDSARQMIWWAWFSICTHDFHCQLLLHQQ